MSRAELLRMARRNLEHVKADTIDRTPEVFRVTSAHYLDPARAALELERVWKRLPLVLALSCELREPGDFRALEVAGVPVLIARGSDRVIRAFVNSCAHRGAQVVTEAAGNARRFVCPYHAWSYDENGALAGVFARGDFGEVDPACHGLVRLPAAERAGLVFVGLTPRAALDVDAFLCGYDRVLAEFGFERWQLVARRSVPGPNWKIAYDGYLDFYHLPILHKNSFGPGLPHRALYDAYGPHQRASFPNPGLLRFEDLPEEQWETQELLAGVWTIFPHVSIATFDAGPRAVLVSQLFPGASPLESVTVQSYLVEQPLDDAGRAAAEKTFELLGHVVREDYATGLRQQRALATGARPEVLFGRNEGGGQRFHRFLDRVLGLDDERLAAELFEEVSP
jgi:phenylpropionate dioxygenase-like ring-hydroxylating dioxygenase large terminal subunit